jgi:outer membrane protein OmpA-like peptidoglycan-associated protein
MKMKLLGAGALLFLLAFDGWGQAPGDELRKSIYFDGGSYFIDEQQVIQLSNWLDSIPNLLEKYHIQLISHTDPIGGVEYNRWLSRMRSNSVYHLLLSKDIPEQYITIKDWGLDNPVYSNNSYRGMRMNRRVDVIVYPFVY